MAKKKEVKAEAPDADVKVESSVMKDKEIKATGGVGEASKGGGGGGGTMITPKPYRVTKISLNPARKINLGNYNTVELNAGIEIVFDKPMDIDDIEVTKAYADAQKIVKRQFIEQYKPYMKSKTTVEKAQPKDSK